MAQGSNKNNNKILWLSITLALSLSLSPAQRCISVEELLASHRSSLECDGLTFGVCNAFTRTANLCASRRKRILVERARNVICTEPTRHIFIRLFISTVAV